MESIHNNINDVLNTTPIAVAYSSISSGHIEYINEAFTNLFGYRLEDLSDIKSWYVNATPEKDHYHNVIGPFIDNTNLSSARDIKSNLICKDGSIKHVNIYISKLNDKKIWYFTDFTDHWVAEERLRARSNMLEMVAKSSALKDILSTIVNQIEQENTQSICSILLFDKEQGCLRVGSAPNLPNFYNEAIDGVQAGPKVGSCGAAAYSKKRVIVADIASHENWQPFAQLAKEAGIAACWSDPILSSTGELLGTFAIYKRYPSTPSEKDFDLINFASRLASIAIESFRAKEELEQRAYFDFLTGLSNRGHFFDKGEEIFKSTAIEKTPLAIIMLDIDDFKKINDIYGHKTGDQVLKKLADISEQILSKRDIAARIGGEEFAFLLAHQDIDHVLSIAEQLRHHIEKSMVLSSENERVFFTVSIGVASKGKDTHYCTLGELLNKADKALYQSKKTGKNKVSHEVYTNTPSLF
ncbi:diguanylate cyclase [Marinomonas sp. C2222]|uniref:diguanylate cyclase n=1 Tax=Marinomonas sargassi TaxID=2984494 RepID=A0ABT2YQN1_9GAMM|nr:diguanylate cyclase [Marinomonas sargassi]MCV2401969.1 diguanylate cyclase [Marinomonas sargassi]